MLKHYLIGKVARFGFASQEIMAGQNFLAPDRDLERSWFISTVWCQVPLQRNRIGCFADVGDIVDWAAIGRVDDYVEKY